jgi:hypothetical protein
MAEKAFFGASKSEINRFRKEVQKDIYGGAPKKAKGKKRSKKRR